ncbi:hypothetical protein C8J56DRAFT_106363 [Mycena floridula]|nr:hypothetical protein C8J56DRAFT_106363 [Mycena floridula]
MDDYAAAMAFLEEDPKVMGIDGWKDSRCQVCQLQWHLWSLGETFPVDERVFEADLTELEDMLRKERSGRQVARGGDFLNLTSGYQHMRLGDSDEAVIYGPQIHDCQPINLQSAIPHGLHTGSDHSFGYIPDVPQHPPAYPQTDISSHDGTRVPWHQGLPGGGSDSIVRRQQGYIKDKISSSNFVERASVGQNGGLGDYAPMEASAVTYPTGNPVRPQITSAIYIEQDVGFTSRNTPPINSQSNASSVAVVGLALPSKWQLADEIKKHLTNEMSKPFC